MKRLTGGATLAVATIIAGTVYAGNNPCKVGGGAPYQARAKDNIQYSANDVEVTVHRGSRIKIVEQHQFHRVDKPAQFHCEAASGCLLIVHAQVYSSTTDVYPCTYVDGRPLQGQWAPHDYSDFTDALIPTGDHSVYTKVWPYNSGSIDHWAITYTMYDQRSGARIRTPAPAN